MIRLAMILAALAAPAAAEGHRVEWHRIGQPTSYLQVVENAEEPGSYVIQFQNERAHSVEHAGRYVIAFPGGSISLDFLCRCGSGNRPDTFTVLNVPAGWEYWPEAIEVQEGESGVIYLWPVIMGMG